jgi:hypothetical protein
MLSARRGAFALLLIASPAFAPAFAADPSPGGVTLGPTTAPAAQSEHCVEVEIGGEKSSKLDCLNEELKSATQRVKPSQPKPPLDASSPSVAVGGFNETAVGQQFGPNFGKSATPFRPPPPTFSNPIH